MLLDRTDPVREFKRRLGENVKDYVAEKTLELTPEAYKLLKRTALERGITINACANMMIVQCITDNAMSVATLY